MTRSATVPISLTAEQRAALADLLLGVPGHRTRQDIARQPDALPWRVRERRPDADGAPPTGFSEPAAPFDRPGTPGAARSRSEAEIAAAAAVFVGMCLSEIERAVIEATIRAHDGSLPRAAQVLGLSPSTLYRKRARWTDR